VTAGNSDSPARGGREWRVKYDGVCSRCGCQLLRGEIAVWERASKTIRCVECPTDRPSERPAVDEGVAGRSARAEYERRAAKRDAAIRERWGDGFAARVVRAVTTEPQSTRAWAIGAAGEEKLAARLAEVEGLRILNDRRVPGTRGNIDHILIGPAGVFVVDAKHYQGMVAIRNRGWLLRPDYRLTVGGRDCSNLADNMAWQVEAVITALGDVDPVRSVIPVLCFVAAEWPLFGAPDEFHGVLIEGPGSLSRLVNREPLLDAAAKKRSRCDSRLRCRRSSGASRHCRA
jgi:Nuclease-related domain